MAQVPTLTYFAGTKTANEVWVYYNLGNAVIKKKKSSTGDILVPNCSGAESCPAGSWDATVLTTPGISAMGALPANAPIYSAIAGEVAPTDPGVSADLVCLPDWSTNVLLCYDDSLAETPGMPFRPVARKYNAADHYVKVRPDQTLRIDDKFVSNWDGLRAIAGRRVTIIVVVMPLGGAAISEVIYYSNFLCIPPAMTYGADQNSNITLSGEGAFSIKAIFSAPKP